MVIQGEGMPILNEPSSKGNLHVEIKIKMPASLDSDARVWLGTNFPHQ
jgi:DnaJ-class molecular chaperone